MNSELRDFCLWDLMGFMAVAFVIGGLAGMLLGFAADGSEKAYKDGQQSCAGCEVVKHAK